MNELFFPVIGAMVVFFVAVPLLTLASRVILWALPTPRDRVLAQVSAWRFSLIVGPTLGPLIWLVSAAIHQSEEGAPLAACVIDHLGDIGGDVCRDVVIFGLLLFSILGVGVLRRVRPIFAPVEIGAERDDATAAKRIRQTCAGNLALAAFSRRIRVVRRGIAPACTRGLLRPSVEIEANLVESLSDEELEATLLHELEHAQARDPLRFFVAQVALSINPLGHLLVPEFSRYHFAREALCDRRAVQRGADPLALARSIISVAAPTAAPSFVAALGGHGIGGVRVRVQLLLGYASRWPGPAGRSAPIGLATVLVTTLAILPHFTGTGPLDLLHNSVEQAVLFLGLG